MNGVRRKKGRFALPTLNGSKIVAPLAILRRQKTDAPTKAVHIAFLATMITAVRRLGVNA